LKEILSKYTWLTGRQPLPPRWALGYLQSKYGYRDENEARSIVTTMREKGIPCDAIILDLYWYGSANLMGNLIWSYAQWPDPATMINDFKAIGIKTILIEEPYITQQSINFQDAFNNGYLGKDAAGTPMVFQHWAGNASLIDMTNPSAQAWWWDKHKPLLDQGVAGWWTDLAEPEIYPPDMFFHLGPMIKVHNIYNLLYSKLIYEGFQSYCPHERLFNLTRSGFAGMQRYSAFPWSGDVSKTFGGLSAQLPILLGMGLSGVGYQGSDIGGFAGPPTTPELYTRWMQFGTFSPIARAHGAQFPTEPWTFDSVVEAICTKYIKLRYLLLPYIYTLAYQNHESGLPLARPLILEYPDDPEVSNLSSEYLWGDAFLVAPVTTEGAQQQTVYLPEGEWINYWTGVLHAGNQTITVDAPLKVLPLFVKNGSIIPMQTFMNYSDEYALDTLILDIYPAASSSYTLYEDDGATNDYQSNAFSLTEFACQSLPQEIDVTIGITEGEYKDKPVDRIYMVQLHRLGAPPDSVLKNDLRLTPCVDSTNFASTNESWWYNENRNLLFVKCEADLNSSHALRVMGTNLITGVEQPINRLATFKLSSNFPNPFNAETMIEYQLPQAVAVEITIFNVQGQKVTSLVNDFHPAGSHKITWNGLSETGQPVASGIYLYQMKAGSFVTEKKMLLLR